MLASSETSHSMHDVGADRCRELAHARLDALALVGERERRALLGEPPGDRPGERALVGDARDEGDLPVQQTHARRLPDRARHATDRTYGILSPCLNGLMRRPRMRPAGPVAALAASALALGAASPDRLTEAHVALRLGERAARSADRRRTPELGRDARTRWRVTYTVTGKTSARSRATRASRCSTARRAGASARRASPRRARRPGSTWRPCRAGFRGRGDARGRGAPDRARAGGGVTSRSYTCASADVDPGAAAQAAARLPERPAPRRMTTPRSREGHWRTSRRRARSSVVMRSSRGSRSSSARSAPAPSRCCSRARSASARRRSGIRASSSSAAHGLRILRCRPVECETQLAYAALGDLLADVPESAMSDLPSPQRRALEVALLRAEPEGQNRSSAQSAWGCSGCCAASPPRRPTLLAIDDVQWLDPPSENALSFAVRRLQDERIGVFCARRGSGPDVPLGLDRALPGGRFERLALRGLDADELDLLLRRARDAALAAGRRARPPRIRRQSLLRARDRAGAGRARRMARPVRRAADPGEPAGARARPARALPAGARAAAQVAAALSRPTVRSWTRRSPERRGPAAAVEAGVLERTASASPSRTRCSRRSPTSCSPRASAARCTRASPRSSTTPRSARGTSPWPPRGPTRRSPPHSTRRPGGPRRAVRRTPPPSCWSRRAD